MNGDIEFFDKTEQQVSENSGKKKIRKGIIYAIVYGIIGIVIGYFLYRPVIFIIAMGDNSSVVENLIAFIFVFGTTIGSWLLLVRFGYRRGVEAENFTSQKLSMLIPPVFKIFFKVVLAIFVVLFIVICITVWYANNVMQQSNTVSNSSTNSLNKDLDQQRYDIMNWMTSAWVTGSNCVYNKKDVLSGNGGDQMCDMSRSTWPIIEVCGANPSDTQWIVTKGSGQEKNITLNCKNVTSCNGQINASCDINGNHGCKFNKGCDPKQK